MLFKWETSSDRRHGLKKSKIKILGAGGFYDQNIRKKWGEPKNIEKKNKTQSNIHIIIVSVGYMY